MRFMKNKNSLIDKPYAYLNEDLKRFSKQKKTTKNNEKQRQQQKIN